MFAVLFRTSIIAALMGLMFGAVAAECPLCDAVREGNLAEVKRLLADGANPNAGIGVSRRKVLYLAVSREKHEIIKVLLAAGANVNAADSYGWTALMLAANRGKAKAAETLLAAGANLNMKDDKGLTALMLAVKPTIKLSNTHVKVAKMLIAAGADVDAVDKRGDTALHRSLLLRSDEARNRHGLKRFLYAAVREYRANIVNALLAAGADVNIANRHGETALHVAALWNHLKIIKTLVAAGADMNASDENGDTAWCYAVGDADVFNAFISAGMHVNKADKEGRRALHCAAIANMTEAAEMLLAAEAYVDTVDRNGVTPLMIAADQGYHEFAKVLLDAGANPDLADKQGKTAWDYIKGKKRMEYMFKKALDEWYEEQ